MLADKLINTRLAVFAELLERADQRFGRTALMKLCYFLQALKGVQLGYDFSLYAYGPFDSEVLADLRVAEDFSVIESSVVNFPGGYQYQLSLGENAKVFKTAARDFLKSNQAAISWVVENFAARPAAELELLSTIVYVDHQGRVSDEAALRDKVKSIKAHFGLSEISQKIKLLREMGLLVTV
jgi:hypothetical protein